MTQRLRGRTKSAPTPGQEHPHNSKAASRRWLARLLGRILQLADSDFGQIRPSSGQRETQDVVPGAVCRRVQRPATPVIFRGRSFASTKPAQGQHCTTFIDKLSLQRSRPYIVWNGKRIIYEKCTLIGKYPKDAFGCPAYWKPPP